MATKGSQEASFQTGQTPIEACEEGSMVPDPTLNEKSIPPTIAQPEETAPPPAYSEGSGIPISQIPAVPTPSFHPPHLRKPIAIPAIDEAFDSPFIRAYPPMLRDYMLPRESFISFLDNLNQVVASSPPLQVLDAAGGILKSVPILFPLHWVGAAVSGIANLGSLGVSKGRTELLIRQANKEIFGPRGLKVEIAKLDALAHMAGIPILDARGKLDPQAPLLQPPPVEAEGEVNGLDAQQRWLKSLQPWIADLELEALTSTSKSKLTRFNAALKEWKGYGRRDDRALFAQRQRLADERQRGLADALADRNRATLELDNEEEKARSRDGKSGYLGERLANIAQDRSRIRRKHDEEVKRINQEYATEDQEDAGITKILWLVIRAVEADSGVVG